MKKKVFFCIVYFIVGILLFHILFSLCLAKIENTLYKNNLINVRNFKFNEEDLLSQIFLLNHIHHPSSKKTILVLGSSFSYGYSLHFNQIYSYFLRKYFPGSGVINASLIGDNGVFLRDNIDFLINKQLRVDKLILEISFTNIKAGLCHNYEIKKTHRSVSENVSTIYRRLSQKISLLEPLTSAPYFFYNLLNPHSINSFKQIEFFRVLNVGRLPKYNYSFVKLPDSYIKNHNQFMGMYPQCKKNISSTLIHASKIATNVYFFISPIYKGGVQQSQFSLHDIKKEYNLLYKACENLPMNVHCLKPGWNFPEKYFMNLAHFNASGHRALAKWLANKINNSK